MTPRNAQSVYTLGPAFKAYEIEELVDVYFFRPLGFIIARFAATLRLTPTQVTVFGALVGIAGGAMLYDERLGLYAFALLILHGIIDSADGQLARMTGQVTELGRALDGGAGYLTHAAIYLAIAAGVMHRGGSGAILIWMVLAGIANAVQAQMYEHHRHDYAMIAVKGLAPRGDPATITQAWMKSLYAWYMATARVLNGLHAEVESVIAARSTAGVVREDDRALYRKRFYGPMRGWNLLGDNMRRYAIGILVCLDRLDLFFAFILLPMNAVLIALWFWQRSADRRFLASL
ncbi:MAG TPA: CDP-alcohol phosphatidyltransferase family protein [Chthoniobacterales bacterium]|nr:CDP-alcohol phosphatidyltransferase family protein [Chthoniobacterales bacterium]